MPRKAKSRRSRRPAQAKKPGRARTKSTIKSAAAREKERQKRVREAERVIRDVAQERREERLKKRALPVHKRLAKAIRTDAGAARQMAAMGLYRPKKARAKLTPGRRKYIKTLREKFRDYLSPDYLFVPVKSKNKKQRRRLIKKAKEAGEETTRKGVMVHRKGDVRAAYFKGENLVAVRTTKDRRGRRHTEKIITPLKSADELFNQKEATRRRFNNAARKTKGTKNAYVRVYIEGKWGIEITYRPEDFEQAWEAMLQYTNADKPGQQNAFISRVRFGVSVPGSSKNKVLSEAELTFLEAQQDALEARAEDGDDDAIAELEKIEAARTRQRKRKRRHPNER
jgi:hypothetical protein